MSATPAALREALISGRADQGLLRLYGRSALSFQKKRYLQLVEAAQKETLGNQCLLVSAPGRTELGGNHTDHNNGRVLAAAVDLDCVAIAAPVDVPAVCLSSSDYPDTIRVDLQELAPRPEEQATPHGLIRGTAAARVDNGRQLGGFSCIVHSTCRPGTGLSSSAAFAITIGTVFSLLCDADLPDPVQLARDAQYAENNFFGKPCGLMDQLSSAVGSTLAIDFQNPQLPVIRRIDSSFEDAGYRLLIIDTGSSHVELTADYAAIPEEIARCTRILGTDKARGLRLEDVAPHLAELRQQAGDRALLRLIHFIAEDQRAARQAEALEAADFKTYLELVRASGRSSCELLQNCSTSKNTHEQGLLLAIALTEHYFPGAICRVHGGGFAGTVQAYIDAASAADYIHFMEQVFGRGSVLPVNIGRPGLCWFDGTNWSFSGNPDGGP